MAGLISDLGNIASLTDSTLIEVEEGLASYNATMLQNWSYIYSKILSIGITPRGHIDGLICSNAAEWQHDITIAPGVARDSTNVMSLILASAITKRIDAVWVAGNNGGIDTGAVAANTVYYVWLIRKDSDGSIDALFSLSATAPTMPAGYTYKRKIMTVCTDADANILPFTQTGDCVKYKTCVADRALAPLANTNRNAYAVTAPPGVEAYINYEGFNSTADADVYLWVADENYVDAAAAAANASLHCYSTTAPNNVNDCVLTNASRQIYARGSSTNIRFSLRTLGWIDNRGRNA